MLWELLAEGEPDDQVDVLIKLNELDAVSNGRMSIVARIGNIICCRIQRSEITKVRHAAGVVSMKASRVYALDPPLRATETIDNNPIATTNRPQRRPDLPYTGKGSIIGVADWGFDFTHPNFINPDGSTRFLAIWDQGAEYDGQNPYGFGTVFSRADINDALQSDTPFLDLGYHPGRTDLMNQGMHGSHVLDIAAGNGVVGESGMAPEAELIGVHLATDRFRDLMGLGDSSRVFNALHFMDELAGERPLVMGLARDIDQCGSEVGHPGRQVHGWGIGHVATVAV